MQKPTRQQVIIGCVAGVAVAALGTLGVFAVLTGGFTHAVGQAPAQQEQARQEQKKDESKVADSKSDAKKDEKKADSATSSTTTSGGDASAAPASGAPVASTQSSEEPSTDDSGKMLATGTVVCTTAAERAAEANVQRPEFANDNTILTLLVLDSPMTVTAYFGEDENHVGQASVICLPNDEMFRRLNGQRITIGVDDWGAFPSDIASMLYDIVLGSRSGLVLVDPV